MKNTDRIIPLEGVLNARELGGIALKGGRQVKHAKIIRTGRLSDMTESDIRVLTDKWNVTRIIDLRNNGEIGEHPDIVPEGTLFQQIAIIPGEKQGISREDHGMEIGDRAIMIARKHAEGDGAQALLESMYAQMARDEYCIGRMKDFFDAMLEQGEGSVVWHCTSGKDRTGVTGVLLLYALGAEMDDIKDDYLFTNQQNGTYRENLLNLMRDRGATEDLVHEIRVLESVDWAYISGFLAEIDRLYGGIDRFLANQMGLTESKHKILLEKYTEEIPTELLVADTISI